MENLKIHVNSVEESEEAQTIFFKLGFCWFSVGQNCHFQNKKFLYTFVGTGEIMFGKCPYFFFDCKNREVSLSELRLLVEAV